MRSLSRDLIAALALAFLVAPAGTAFAAWPHDAITHVPLAPPGVDQELGDMLADGAGGAYAVWTDKRGGTEDIYLQRVTASGAIAPGWPAGGFQASTAIGKKLEPQLASDGSGGLYVVWADYRAGLTNGDIWAQHVLANGTLAGGWPAGGLQVTALPVNERRVRICGDGGGGLFAAWEYDYSTTDTDVYGAHVNFGGTVVFSQALNGNLSDSRQLAVAADGGGGYFVAYQDSSLAQRRVFAMHVSGTGVLIAGPLNLSTGPGSVKKQPHLVADASGGIYAAWMDNYTFLSDFDIAISHLDTNLSPLSGFFGGYGTTQSPMASVGADFSMIPDGSNGLILAWTTAAVSNHIYLAHYAPSGASYTGASPVDVPIFSDYGVVPRIASDGSGGALVAGWAYPSQEMVLRITSSGTVGLRWPWQGTMASSWSSPMFSNLVSDGAHGAIVAWSDGRNGGIPTGLTVYAQRIDLFGALGNAEPTIVSIKDAPKDNGGNVRLIWNASYLDVDPTYEIGSYWIWRQTPAVAAAGAVRAGARWLGAGVTTDAATLKPGRVFQPSSVAGFAWEYLASQPANASAQYSLIAPTSLDSTASSNSRTTFMVEARSNVSGFWDSPPDSGYSVDNIPPVAPAPFFGQYSAGSATLGWGPNTEPDFQVYLLYRGSNASFTPGPSNLVAQTVNTNYLDASVPTAWYKLAAMDIHGNVSPYSTLLPTGALDVAGTQNWTLAFAPIGPDPAAGAVTLRFTTPKAGLASLTLVDAQGRAVRRFSESVGAGPHEWTWSGEDARGAPAATGLYFARFTFEGREITRRFVRIR